MRLPRSLLVVSGAALLSCAAVAALDDVAYRPQPVDGDAGPDVHPPAPDAGPRSDAPPTTPDVDAAGSTGSPRPYVEYPAVMWEGTAVLSEDVADLPACRKLCDDSPACAALSFEERDARPSSCTVRRDVGRAVVAAAGRVDLVVATDALTKFTVEIGNNHGDNDLASFDGQTPAGCAVLCDQAVGCVGYVLSYDPTHAGRCWLKRAFSRPLADGKLLAFCRPGTTNCSGIAPVPR